MTLPNRWIIALAGLLMEIVLGAIYTWSVFSIPLSARFGWTLSQVTVTFEIAILVLGFVALFGSFWLRHVDSRLVAIMGGILFSGGIFLGSFAAHGLWVLYLGVGLIAGAGLGVGYIVPIAVMVGWFPDRRALMSGVAVCGFGTGALITAPIATHLIEAVGVTRSFADLGIAFLVITVGAGLLLRSPPPNWTPSDWRPEARHSTEVAAHDFDLGSALKSWQWWALAATLFLNVALGVSLISQEDPIFRALGHVSAEVAGSLVGVAALGNAFGRVFWAWISDFLTRRVTFAVIFVLEAALFTVLPGVHDPLLLTATVFFILTCFGGSVGTMPAFVADCFGSRNVGAIYGAMLAAWGLGTVFGSSLLTTIQQRSGTYPLALHVLAGIALLSAILPLVIRPLARPIADVVLSTSGILGVVAVRAGRR